MQKENQPRKPIEKKNRDKFLITNQFFKLARAREITIRLYWSERVQMHFVHTSKLKKGFLFEDGTFVSDERFMKELNRQEMSDEMLKVYLAGLREFADKGYMLCN